MILCVSLNTTIDTVIPLNTLKKGSVARAPFVISYPGGKAVNTARALSVLGAKVSITGFCGSDDLSVTSNFLRKSRVAPDFIPLKGSNRECFIINEFSPVCESVINSESGFIATTNSLTKLKSSITFLSKKCSYTLFSGSLPKGVNTTAFASLSDAVAPGSLIIVDTYGPALKGFLKARADILKINLEEAQNTFNRSLRTRKEITGFSRTLLKKYRLRAVIITMGAKGVLAVTKNKYIFRNSIRIKGAVSPVGSGDAFTAGLLFSLEKNNDLEVSIKYGIACAAANLSKAGACFIDKKEFLKYLKGQS